MCPWIPVPAPVSIVVAGPDSWVFHSNRLVKNSAVRALSREPISKCTTRRPMGGPFRSGFRAFYTNFEFGLQGEGTRWWLHSVLMPYSGKKQPVEGAVPTDENEIAAKLSFLGRLCSAVFAEVIEKYHWENDSTGYCQLSCVMTLGR